MVQYITTDVLKIGYYDYGPPKGTPVLLLHGFPYDVHAYDQVSGLLVAQGCRVIVPYLRGYGNTRFLSAETLRSGQQAALAHDLLSLMDALEIDTALLAGFDWGGRAACIVAALWPERVHGLVTVGGYNIQNIRQSTIPATPENEYRSWYQYYLHSERGRTGLLQHRDTFCRLLWQLWSPTWEFTEHIFRQSALSFENPDFVAVVTHSYRHRFGLVAGPPCYDETERLLSAQPDITVPTLVIDGGNDGVAPIGGSLHHRDRFTAHFAHRLFPGVGHNPPQEAPEDFAQAVLALL